MGPSSEHRPAGVRPEARPSSSTASGTLKSSILQEDVHTSGAGGGWSQAQLEAARAHALGRAPPIAAVAAGASPPYAEA